MTHIYVFLCVMFLCQQFRLKPQRWRMRKLLHETLMLCRRSEEEYLFGGGVRKATCVDY